MGCGPSYRYVYSNVPGLQKWQAAFETLTLSERDVGRIYKIFRKVDEDGSGAIQILEMLNYFDIDNNKFSKRVFGIFDEDCSGQIDFREFIIALWNYCTLEHSTLSLFAFDLYDKDSSGEIDRKEVLTMLEEVYGKTFSTNSHAQKIAEKINTLGIAVVIDKDFFRDFCRKHQALLYPAFELQRVIRRKCMGKAFWQEYSQRRLKMSNGKYLTIAQINELINHNTLHHHVHIDDIDEKKGLVEAKGTHAKRKLSKTDTEPPLFDDVSSNANQRRNSKPDMNAAAGHHHHKKNQVVPAGIPIGSVLAGHCEDPKLGAKPIITTGPAGQSVNELMAQFQGRTTVRDLHEKQRRHTIETMEGAHGRHRRGSTGNASPGAITHLTHELKKDGSQSNLRRDGSASNFRKETSNLGTLHKDGSTTLRKESSTSVISPVKDPSRDGLYISKVASASHQDLKQLHHGISGSHHDLKNEANKGLHHGISGSHHELKDLKTPVKPKIDAPIAETTATTQPDGIASKGRDRKRRHSIA